MSSQKSALPVHTTSPKQNTPRKVSLDLDPYAAPAEYYGKSHGPRKVAKSRTYSAHDPIKDSSPGYKNPGRRLSHDAQGNAPRRYQIKVDETRAALLKSEDTDDNEQITIDDHGPKTINLRTAASGGHHLFDIRGTYMLSNLLQELTLAKAFGLKEIVLDEARLNENPVNRMARLIKDVFWKNLTRTIDGSNIFTVAYDTKVRGRDPRPRIYVPRGAPEQYEYYQRISTEHEDKRLEVLYLDENPGKDEYVLDLNTKPGLLAIEMEKIEDTPNGKPDFRGLPFIVPGGRFNELYGWDSYMETLGLLVNDKVDLCENMVRHFCFSIKHYGKILNANRSYYLCRSQPPFLTDMALRVYDRIKHRPDSLEFLRTAFLAAIKDYYGTWMSEPRYDKASGLSCYRPGGLGVPPETEATHFLEVITPYAEKHNMTFEQFVHAYNSGGVFEPKLDEYFRHDRAVRESGHDTSYRLEGKAADLATVDLNSCLYKIEVDIARVIRNFFGDKLVIPQEWRAKGQAAFETSAIWDRRAKKRRQAMEKLMWDEEKGMFFDYFVTKGKHTDYESATTFWAMWAGTATPRQAQMMVNKALPLFEVHGGLVSGTQSSRRKIGLNRPNRQWDYPFGWAPQQILAWTGFLRYGFEEEAQRLAYRWIYMCTKAFVDFNGVVVEKYNVTEQIRPHKVTAEYGNQGSDFKGAPTEGFGWVNASYVYGLQIVNTHMKRCLGWLAPWDTFKKMTEAANAVEAQEILEHDLKKQRAEEKAEAVEHAHAHHTALPHSHEDEVAHKAVHGAEERKEHKGPEEVKH